MKTVKKNYYDIKAGEIFLSPSNLEQGQVNQYLKLENQGAVSLPWYSYIKDANRIWAHQELEVLVAELVLKDKE